MEILQPYPDYEMQESLFEIKITRTTEEAKDLIAKTTVTLSL
jgi:HlyD family secretion protein